MEPTSSTSGRRVIVAGAGISGLATALAVEDLARERALPIPDITLLEADSHPGGKIRTINADGFTCEWGVNGFLNKEPATLELVRRIDHWDQLLPASGAYKNRFLFVRGKLRPVQMHPLKFMFSGLLPFGAKLRLIRELWVKSQSPGDRDESVAEFARRRVGPVAFQTLVDAMQTGIYAGDPERMSVVSSFPRVVEVERDYGSLIKGMARLARERRAAGEPLPGAGPRGHLTSFKGGMQSLIDQLARTLGDRIRYEARVRAVERDPEGGYALRIEGTDEPLRADVVVLACPAFSAASAVQGLDADLAHLLSEIPYSPLVVACLGYAREQVRHPMDGFGFLVPRDQGLRILGALWTSTLFPGRAPEGQVLIRAMIGGARDPDVLELDDQELTQLVQRDIFESMGGEGQPTFTRIFRHRCAIPQYVIGHAERLRLIDAQLAHLPGLVITGNAYRGIGVNDCVANARPTAERILGALG
jgi:oxygen-dependent protoporphyrinogen oxidase